MHPGGVPPLSARPDSPGWCQSVPSPQTPHAHHTLSPSASWLLGCNSRPSSSKRFQFLQPMQHGFGAWTVATCTNRGATAESHIGGAEKRSRSGICASGVSAGCVGHGSDAVHPGGVPPLSARPTSPGLRQSVPPPPDAARTPHSLPHLLLRSSDVFTVRCKVGAFAAEGVSRRALPAPSHPANLPLRFAHGPDRLPGVPEACLL